ncbi:hypothetical protein ONZ43_g6125 [Nemania bipapillata]|uniref:Uncharacterized protein n=1 Tax=Nemania bipapillata TaxID=110536 RepID=A0ACC2I290_9PEZI|nr:hypothetical protein ONZ43_g6125 [Nemania bipapillata]
MSAQGLWRLSCILFPATTGTVLASYYPGPFAQRVRNLNHTISINESADGSISTSAEEKKKLDTSTLFEPPVVAVQPKDEVLEIVDYYDEVLVDECLEFHQDPYLRKYASADGPNLTISDKPEDVEPQSMDGDRKFVEEESELARHLRLALIARRRRRADVSLDSIWDLYEALPQPRSMQITSRTRGLLMAALGSGERKNQKSMLRYFNVVADVKNSGFSLTTAQWNMAISFAAGYIGTTTEAEVETALKLWREMENEAGVKGNEVTFNILFDAASKAGKFSLAEMIYEEMTRRGFAFNRYHHVSLIHFFGLKQDSSGVRAAYKEMVEAGEIVDATVLNCLIASFIRCGEEPSAEHVYEKMKASNKDLPMLPHRDYTMEKAITKVLTMFARVGKKHPSMRSAFQGSALLSPNLDTYRILINHYGVQLGNLSKSAQFLDEMKSFNVPLNGVIFLALFQSFAIHGGSGSDWSAQRLNSVWNAFLDAIDAEADGLYISTWVGMAILKAHARYCNRDEILEVYECLHLRWDLDHTNAQYMLHFLQKLLNTNGLNIPRQPWTSTSE